VKVVISQGQTIYEDFHDYSYKSTKTATNEHGVTYLYVGHRQLKG